MIDREFLLIKRKARRRALWNALTQGPAAMFSYALGRACYRAEMDFILYGYRDFDADRAVDRIRSVHRRLIKTKGRLNV